MFEIMQTDTALGGEFKFPLNVMGILPSIILGQS